MKKVLFTGATGLLGKYFFNSPQKGFELFGTFNKNTNLNRKNFYPLDVSNNDEVFALVKKIKPSYIVHAAALGNVDYCQTHKDEAERINVQGTRNVAEAASEIGAMILFTSSNAVFDGENPPYSEESKLNPLDYYGKTKQLGEEIVKKIGSSYVILRLVTMYGWPSFGGRNNPVAWIIDELRNKRRVNVVTDIFNNHLYVRQASDVIWEIIKKEKKNEIYNVSGAECVSRYDLALKVAEVFELDKAYINPVNSDFFEKIAKRPKNTCFDTTKIGKDFNFKPLDIISGLKLMKNERS